MITFSFPDQFLWGTGSSSFQIEGGAQEGGKGPSIWDTACRVHAQRFSKGATPEVAADFYHRYREDIALMKELGLKSFRLSIAWPRLFPQGRGEVNEEGVAFYDSVIDCLLENEIEPFVDLYHWDLPQALQDEGGFEQERIIRDFETYARVCFERFGDRVKLWSTFNEPSVVALSSYAHQAFPPYKDNLASGLSAAQNLIRAHFAAIRAYRETGYSGKIGAVVAFVPVYPDTHHPSDAGAALRQQDFVSNWWLRPMFEGRYPESVLDEPEIREAMRSDYPEILAREFVPMDFVGINYYYPARTAFCEESALRSKHVEVFYAQSDYGFQIYPQGLYDALCYLKDNYGNPEVYLTENGLGNARFDSRAGELKDHNRIQYLQEHLREMSRAIRAGCNVKGYYYWSHFDDFEAERGYDINFGLLHVDRDTMERTPRLSWYFYRDCIANNRVS